MKGGRKNERGRRGSRCVGSCRRVGRMKELREDEGEKRMRGEGKGGAEK